MNSFKDILISPYATVEDAMRLIDTNMTGVCFVVEGDELLGSVTDGDIRRAVLDRVDISTPVKDLMCTACKSLPVGSSPDLINKYVGKYGFVPLLDSQGRLVDVASKKKQHHISLVEPQLNGNELAYVSDCILSGWVSSQGKYVADFENKFSEFIGGGHCLSVSSGTVGLHLALVVMGIKPGDEVIVPDLTFAATINAVIYTGATPVIVDVDPKTMNIDPIAIAKAISPKTKAIIPVHLYGQPANLEAIETLAAQHDISIIEDCAEALGSSISGRHVGTTSDAAIFSFFGNKTITTGEGGMIVFNSIETKSRAKKLRDHGMNLNRRYWHDEVGFNYRLTNMQAALGVAQLERAQIFIDKKRWIAREYDRNFIKHSEIITPIEIKDHLNSYWLYTIIIKDVDREKLSDVSENLMSKGIETRPLFFPLHEMPPYVEYSKGAEHYVNSSTLSKSGLCLPGAFSITSTDISYICISVLEALDE